MVGCPVASVPVEVSCSKWQSIHCSCHKGPLMAERMIVSLFLQNVSTCFPDRLSYQTPAIFATLSGSEVQTYVMAYPVLRNSTTNYQAQQRFEIMHWSVKNRVRILLFQTDFDLSHTQNLIDCYSGDFPLTQALFFLINALNHCKVSEGLPLQTESRKIWTQHLGRWKLQGRIVPYILVLQRDFPWSAAAHARICKLS